MKQKKCKIQFYVNHVLSNLMYLQPISFNYGFIEMAAIWICPLAANAPVGITGTFDMMIREYFGRYPPSLPYVFSIYNAGLTGLLKIIPFLYPSMAFFSKWKLIKWLYSYDSFSPFHICVCHRIGKCFYATSFSVWKHKPYYYSM